MAFTLKLTFAGLVTFVEQADRIVVLFPNLTDPDKSRVDPKKLSKHQPVAGIAHSSTHHLPDPTNRHYSIRVDSGSDAEPSLRGLGLVNVSEITGDLDGDPTQKTLYDKLLKPVYDAEASEIVVTRVEFKPGCFCVKHFRDPAPMEYLGERARHFVATLTAIFDDVTRLVVVHRDLGSEEVDEMVIEPAPRQDTVKIGFGNFCDDRADRPDFKGHYNLMATPSVLNGKFPHPRPGSYRTVPLVQSEYGVLGLNPQCSPAEIRP